MRLTTVLLGVTRALAAVKARCSAPPPLRGADGLDAGSAHARPGSCLTMTNSPTPESEACETPGVCGLAQSSILLVNTHLPWIADWMPALEDRRHAERWK